jgi:hypothetical protein
MFKVGGVVREQPVDREGVLERLRDASELEHQLCCQYLYAGWTLVRGGERGAGPDTAALAAQWDQQIIKIATQEMYHLLMVSNIRTALGGEPYLHRPDFPQLASRYSEIGLPSLLAPFSANAVDRFLCWEKPEGPGWWDDHCKKRLAEDQKLAAMAVPPPPYRTIGQLYRDVETALLANAKWIDPTTAAKQVTSELVPFSPKVAPIISVQEAKGYIDRIVTQGEGGPDWSLSHFAYFNQVRLTLASLATKASFAWPTVENPSYRSEPAGGSSPITDPGVRAVGQLFNDLYTTMLRTLARLFIPEGESPGERQSLANAAMAIMPLALKPLGIQLCRIPAGQPYAGRFAGPSFELPPSLDLPRGPYRKVGQELAEELRAEALRARVLEAKADDHDLSSTLGLVGARLETIAPLYESTGARV